MDTEGTEGTEGNTEGTEAPFYPSSNLKVICCFL
jgi:hypothetical protein